METKLLILDLDETLVYATEKRLARLEDFRVETYFLYRRPNLDHFIEFLFKYFKVAVWTSSSESYADGVVQNVFQQPERLHFVWARERCTYRIDGLTGKDYWIKDIKKVKRLGFSLDSILIIDDSAEKISRSYGNHICVTPFEGDPTDNELAILQSYLLWLKDIPGVRSVEKRNWRTFQMK